MARQRGAANAGGGMHSAPLDSMLSQDEPLDEHEQEQVIREFENMQISQARTFRAVFGGGALLCAAFFAWAANEQAVRPWEQRYTGELRTVVGARGAALSLAVQAAALGAAALGMLLRLPRPGEREHGCVPAGSAAWAALGSGACGAAGTAAYWGAALRRSVEKHGAELGAHWDLLWLPLAPLGYVLMCCYIMHSVGATAREVQRLKRMTYSFKKV